MTPLKIIAALRVAIDREFGWTCYKPESSYRDPAGFWMTNNGTCLSVLVPGEVMYVIAGWCDGIEKPSRSLCVEIISNYSLERRKVAKLVDGILAKETVPHG
jgi:hypothetical protein